MGRVWFITGCSKGLGLSIAQQALDAGDSLVATARQPETLRHLVEKYGQNRVLPLRLDVTNREDVDAAVAAGVQKFGRLDVVVNNAGFANIESFEDGSLDSFRAHIDTNLLGAVYVTKAVIPQLRKQGDGGRILQVSSVGGRLASPGLSAYQAAKWALGGFTQVVQKEVEPFGIKMTVLEPGGIKTDWATGDGGAPISEAYQQTVGAFGLLREKYRAFASEPSSIARVILKVSESPDPPLRLLLGPETVELAKDAAVALSASDEKWRAATLLQL